MDKKQQHLFLSGLKYFIFGCSVPNYVYMNTAYKKLVLTGISLLCASFLLTTVDVILTKSTVSEIILGLYTAFQTLSFASQWILITLNLRKIVDMNLNLVKFKSFQLKANKGTKVLNKNLKLINKLNAIYKVIITATSTSYIIGPLIQGLWPLLSNEKIKPIYVFPLGFCINPVYSIFLYMPQVGVIVLVTFVSIGFFEWVTAIAILIYTQIIILEEVFSADEYEENEITWVNIIEDFHLLLDNTNTFLQIFQSVVFCKITICAYTLTLATLTIASDQLSVYDLFNLLLDNTLYFTELCVFCYVGSLISFTLSEVGNYVYFGKWYLKGMEWKHKKDISFVIHWAQKPLVPKVWFGTVKIQLPTIIDILQLCYSYYNVLAFIKK